MATTITGLAFVDYAVVDDGILLHFTIQSGGSGGMASEYYINLTDVEINSARNASQLKMIVQRKIDRLLNGAGIATLLDGAVGTVFTPSSPSNIPAYLGKDGILGSQILITPLSINALGVEFGAMNLATPVSTAWGTANLARGYPFIITKPLVVQKLFWYNGATVNGNVACGIYSEDGNLLVSTGSTVQVGANILQEVAVTNTLLGCGRYYMVLISSSTTATFFSSSPGIQGCKALGVLQASVSIPLPSTIIPAAYASAFIPLFGLSSRTLVV